MITACADSRRILLPYGPLPPDRAPPFWTAFNNLAHERRQMLGESLREVAAARAEHNLSSAIRVFVLEHYMDLARQADQEENVQLP